jgi:hypothetical protein
MDIILSEIKSKLVSSLMSKLTKLATEYGLSTHF